MTYQPDPRAADRLAAMTQNLADATSIPNGTVINASMGPRVLTIVFPSSGAPADRIDEATLLQSIEETGSRSFVALGGNL